MHRTSHEHRNEPLAQATYCMVPTVTFRKGQKYTNSKKVTRGWGWGGGRDEEVGPRGLSGTEPILYTL